MTLLPKIQDDIKLAQKAGNPERVDVLRFLLAQVHNKEIEKRGKGKDEVLSDEEVIEVLQKEVKKRKESIELFRKGNRGDLVRREEEQLAFVLPYVPAMMGRPEVEKIIDKLVASGVSAGNDLMKAAMQKLKGKADGRMVAEIVKERMK